MSSVLSKIMGTLSDTGDYEDDYTYEEIDPYDQSGNNECEAYANASFPQNNSSTYVQKRETFSKVDNVIEMPKNSRFWPSSTTEVVVLEPQNFDEIPLVVQALIDRKSVILNLTLMDVSQAQRSVDFVAGATMMLNGHQERVGDCIFLFTPNCVQVKTHIEPAQNISQPQKLQLDIPSNEWTNDPVLSQIAI